MSSSIHDQPKVARPGSALPKSSRSAILAIDYGRRRLGLALSDGLGMTAHPLAVCTRSNRRADVTHLREICRRHEVGLILVGWPLHLDGSAGEMAEETSRFAERLRRQLGLPVELVDERLSSWEAHQVTAEITSAARSSRRDAKTVDDVAAAVILRDYLSRARRDGQV